MSLALNPRSPEKDFRKIMYEYSLKDFLLLHETVEILDALYTAEEKDAEQERLMNK